ncbi:MAG TPA: nucleoside triphosphate pyrophosphohydrolase [Granulicella sp.]|jgi:XTP/dITP diphosphohydrolase/ATP diphosphatase|nr:nucleoside triphosphate pyrophosphohydrolase [Granulicella sp.]
MAESILPDQQPSQAAAALGGVLGNGVGSNVGSSVAATTPAQRVAPAQFAEAVEIMARLRAPDGCPWDREQTFDTIKRHTLEETYEVFDAIERRAWPELKDELGDLLLQVLFYAQMAAEEGRFDITDVVQNLNAKLIRRHPHIFADTVASDADAVLRNWEQIKREEKKQKQETHRASLLDDVPRSMPAVLEAAKLGSKAAKVGFDWPDPDGRATGLFEKLQEEIAELQAEIVELKATEQTTEQATAIAPESRNGDAPSRAAIEAELGDVLFTAVNLARHLKVDPESALRATNAKFRRRFGAMEKAAGDADRLERSTPAELEELWSRAKLEEVP